MTDREKVIAWLTEISLRPCDFTRDDFDTTETEHLADDALAMLKKQAPEEPKWLEFEDGLTGQKYEVPSCGFCGTVLSGDEWYCPQCGKEVKWDET